MKIFFYISKILLYISMVIWGFLNITAWSALSFKYGYPAYGWVLLAAIVISYAGILIADKLKKYLLMFISSLIFPITSIVIGVGLRNIAGAKGNLDFSATFLRNHLLTLVIILFAGLVWAVHMMLPEQRFKRRERDHRRLKPEEHIL